MPPKGKRTGNLTLLILVVVAVAVVILVVVVVKLCVSQVFSRGIFNTCSPVAGRDVVFMPSR